MTRIMFGLLMCLALRADTMSFTGSLATPESVLEHTFTLTAASDVFVQTWGFGGSTNAFGTAIPAGGFDPLVALFSGPPASATILTDSLGNAIAGADTLTSFIGNCPPAGTVTIGTGTGSDVCGDVFLDAPALAPGTYTLLLSDADYIPVAVNPGPPVSNLLSDGFTDLTGGVFQTCNLTSDGTFCITPANNYAVDLILSPQAAPEPGFLWLIAALLAVLAPTVYRRKRAV